MESTNTKKKQGQCKGPDLETTKLIEGLKADVMEVKKMFSETLGATKSHPSTDTGPSIAVRWTRGCQACREAQDSESCTHCYRCGQEGHLSHGTHSSHSSSRSQVNSVFNQAPPPSQNLSSDDGDRLLPATPQTDETQPTCDTPTGYVPSQRQAKLISLIGRRCLVQCHLVVEVEALWGTGGTGKPYQ